MLASQTVAGLNVCLWTRTSAEGQALTTEKQTGVEMDGQIPPAREIKSADLITLSQVCNFDAGFISSMFPCSAVNLLLSTYTYCFDRTGISGRPAP